MKRRRSRRRRRRRRRIIIIIIIMTLHVSDGLSVHHQEFKIVHTATGICLTDTAVCR